MCIRDSYWAAPHTLSGDNIRLISYSVPLIAPDGTVYLSLIHIFAFFDLAAVEIAVAGSKGDKACCNFVRRLHHVGGVFVLGGVRVKVCLLYTSRCV